MAGSSIDTAQPLPARHPLLLSLRGVLALAVVLHHTSRVDLGAGYARVILFFVISGYAIFAAAEAMLARCGAGTSSASAISTSIGFLARRSVRIWPPYVLSLVYIAVFSGLSPWPAAASPNRAPPMDRSAWVWLANLSLTSWTTLIEHPKRMAWQNPDLIVTTHWTLGYEVQFYIVVAAAIALAAVFKVRLKFLAVVLALIGLASLGRSLVAPQRSHGLIWDYALSFAIGAAAYYGCSNRSGARVGVALPTLIAGCAVALGAANGWLQLPESLREAWKPDAGARRVLQETVIAACFGVFLIVAFAPCHRFRRCVPRPLARVAGFLGAISYSLFLVHPVHRPLAASLAGRMLPSGAPAAIEAAATLGMHVALVIPFWFCCERPFARLRRRSPSSVSTPRTGPESQDPRATDPGPCPTRACGC